MVPAALVAGADRRESGLIVAAAALGIWGERTLKRAGTNANPREPTLAIVSDGPYRFTRNPLYVALIWPLPRHHPRSGHRLAAGVPDSGARHHPLRHHQAGGAVPGEASLGSRTWRTYGESEEVDLVAIGRMP